MDLVMSHDIRVKKEWLFILSISKLVWGRMESKLKHFIIHQFRCSRYSSEILTFVFQILNSTRSRISSLDLWTCRLSPGSSTGRLWSMMKEFKVQRHKKEIMEDIKFKEDECSKKRGFLSVESYRLSQGRSLRLPAFTIL